jgi:hypothetical protein
MYEFDTSTDFDPAPSGTGPWLHFYIKASADNSIPAGAWSLTDAGTRHTLDLSDGFILDWRATLTGWVQATGVPGVAPVKVWNPSRAKFMPRPPGNNWQKGFLAPIAYANDAAAVWEQWGAGIWMGFSEMFVTLMQSAPGQLPRLPLIVPGTPIPRKFAKGMSLKPTFSVSRYMPAPVCLTELGALALQSAVAAQGIAPLAPSPAHQLVQQPAAQSPDRWGVPPSLEASPPSIKPAGWGPPGAPTPDESDPLDDEMPF